MDGSARACGPIWNVSRSETSNREAIALDMGYTPCTLSTMKHVILWEYASRSGNPKLPDGTVVRSAGYTPIEASTPMEARALFERWFPQDTVLDVLSSQPSI